MSSEKVHHQSTIDKEQLAQQRLLESRRYDALFEVNTQNPDTSVFESSSDDDSSDDSSDDTNSKEDVTALSATVTEITSTKDIYIDTVTQCASQVVGQYFPVAITNIIVDLMISRLAIVHICEAATEFVSKEKEWVQVNINKDKKDVEPMLGDIRITYSDNSTASGFGQTINEITSLQVYVADDTESTSSIVNNNNNVAVTLSELKSMGVNPRGTNTKKFLTNTEADSEMPAEGTGSKVKTDKVEDEKKKETEEESKVIEEYKDKDVWQEGLKFWKYNGMEHVNPYRENYNSLNEQTIYIPYQLTGNQLFRNLCLNDVILHFIPIIKCGHDGIKRMCVNPKDMDLLKSIIQYIVFEFDKFDDFIRYQVIPNNIQFTNYTNENIIFDLIPKEWRFYVVFTFGSLSKFVFISFENIGNSSNEKNIKLNNQSQNNLYKSLTKYYKIPIFKKPFDDDNDNDHKNKIKDVTKAPEWSIEQLIERYNLLTRFTNIEFKISFQELNKVSKQERNHLKQKFIAFDHDHIDKEMKIMKSNLNEMSHDNDTKIDENGKNSKLELNSEQKERNEQKNEEKHAQIEIEQTKEKIAKLGLAVKATSWEEMVLSKLFEHSFRHFMIKNGIPKGWHTGFDSKNKCYQFRGIEKNQSFMTQIIDKFCKEYGINDELKEKIVIDRNIIHPINS